MAQKKLEKVNYIVVHCSATKADMDVGAKEIDHWHREKGFLKIGYHAVIRRDGRVEWGRELNEIGAHAYGVNNKSLGICLVGGLDERGKPEMNYTLHQMLAIKYVIKLFLLYHPNARVIGHRDVPNTKKDCPCFDVVPWWDEIQ